MTPLTKIKILTALFAGLLAGQALQSPPRSFRQVGLFVPAMVLWAASLRMRDGAS